MKQAIRFAVGFLCLSLLSVASAVAQDQYTEGGVTRVTLVQILPGHFNAFMDDLKTNIKPIWDAEKKAGPNFTRTRIQPVSMRVGATLPYSGFLVFCVRL